MKAQGGDISDRISELVIHFANGNNSLFATMIGTSEANVRNYRNGVQPKYDVLSAIAQRLEISCEWLLTGRCNMILTEPAKPPCNDEHGGYLVDTQKELISLLKEKVSSLEEQLASLKKESTPKRTTPSVPCQYGQKLKQ